MELNSEQIKKATECCGTRDCDKCPYTDNKEICFEISEAPTIIKELLDRIEILESQCRVNDKVGEDYVTLHAAYTELTRTCMTLTDKVKVLNEQYDALLDRNVELAEQNEKIGIENFDLICELSRIKEDTVRKFAERLKKRNKVYCINKSDLEEMNFVIDQIAQEMIGEQNNALG